VIFKPAKQGMKLKTAKKKSHTPLNTEQHQSIRATEISNVIIIIIGFYPRDPRHKESPWNPISINSCFKRASIASSISIIQKDVVIVIDSKSFLFNR
jgi:hypothetical protein